MLKPLLAGDPPLPQPKRPSIWASSRSGNNLFPLPHSSGDDDKDDSDDGPLQTGTQLADGNVDAELVSGVVSGWAAEERNRRTPWKNAAEERR